MPRIAVLGAGVTGLSAAREIERFAPRIDTLVLEARSRIGGVVETEHTQEGFLLEHGPDALLTRKPTTKTLLSELGMADDLLRSSDGPGRTYVLKNGRLAALPEGLVGFAPTALWPMLCSPLLSPIQKLRLVCEPWIHAVEQQADESIESFVSRRFGAGFLDAIVRPVLEGVYGDGATELSAHALLPFLVSAETKYGSVARGMLQMQGSSGPSKESPFITPRLGMASVVRSMAAQLRTSPRTHVKVKYLSRVGSELELELFGGARLRVDGLVLAVPAREAARLVEGLHPDLACALGDLPHGDLQLVSLAFPREAVAHKLDGTGFVASSREGRVVRACTWSSKKWPGRAPEGTVLMRCFLHMPAATEDELCEAATREVQEVLGIEGAPLLTRVRSRAATLPRSTVGHAERIEHLRALCAELPNIRLAGSAIGTVGVPDCAQSGVLAGRELASILH